MIANAFEILFNWPPSIELWIATVVLIVVAVYLFEWISQ